MTPRHTPGIAAAISLALPGLLLTAAPAGARQVALAPAPAPPRPSVITAPTWARPPYPDFPERALSEGVPEGRVVLQCGVAPDGLLPDCRIMEETPVGYDFGAAALAGAQQARMRLPTGMVVPPGAQVRFAVRFVQPDVPPRLPVLLNPAWARYPRATFPRAAAKAGITEARVQLDCEQHPGDGRLQNCVVTQEDPAGHGFGEAALRAAHRARVSGQSRDTALPNAHVIFTVPFSR